MTSSQIRAYKACDDISVTGRVFLAVTVAITIKFHGGLGRFATVAGRRKERKGTRSTQPNLT